jgi:hypothetical protein
MLTPNSVNRSHSSSTDTKGSHRDDWPLATLHLDYLAGQSKTPPLYQLVLTLLWGAPHQEVHTGLSDKFYPGTSAVIWKANVKSVTQGMEGAQASKQSNKYMTSSYLSLMSYQRESYYTLTKGTPWNRVCPLQSVLRFSNITTPSGAWSRRTPGKGSHPLPWHSEPFLNLINSE